MKNAIKHDMSDIPEDFEVVNERFNDTIIRFKPVRMLGVKIFLTLWLSLWTFFCILLLRTYLNGGLMDDGRPTPLWIVCVFWAIELGVGCLCLFIFFGKRSFHISQSSLIANWELFGIKRSKTIARDSIKSFRQFKYEEEDDYGKDGARFPIWGLVVKYEKKVTLIRRQKYDNSHWLGKFLADWAGVVFHEASTK